MYAQSDIRFQRTPWFGGTPWQKNAPIDVYWNNSPLKDVANVKTYQWYRVRSMYQGRSIVPCEFNTGDVVTASAPPPIVPHTLVVDTD